MFKKMSTAVLAGSLGLVGCASVNSISLTPVPAGRSHPVKAEASKTIFLAFNFNNDYIDTLVADLKQQCPNGVVSGILTKDETISYVLATGFCNTAVAGDSEKKPAKALKGKTS